MKKIGEIDYDLKLPKKSISLCRPNRQTIAIINEAYDIQYLTKLGALNEISFKIPSIIAKDGVPQDNPNITRIKHRYLFRLKIGSVTEYFIFNENDITYGDDEYIEYRALLLPNQLSDKNVREYEQIGNLSEVANGVLDDVYGDILTNPIKRWTVGYVDSHFLVSEASRRKYSVSSMTLLETIFDMAEKWNAVLRWDTKNLKIDFILPENAGLNKGFSIRDGKYLESFGLNVNSNETVTRLKAYGSEGLTFRGINPIGEDYIQDFTYYMYPFEYDYTYNRVIKSSDYMSDSLCIAITKFNKKVEDLAPQFELITNRLNALNDEYLRQNQILTDKKLEVTLIENERDVLLSEFQPDKALWGTNGFNYQGTKENTPAHLDILQRLRAAELEQSNQQTIVDNAYLMVQDEEQRKQAHLAQLSTPNNFTIDQISELEDFIIVKEYTNDSITNPEDLLKETKVVFDQGRAPKIKLNVNIVDFLSVVECQNDWDKLGLGDTIKVKYDRLNVHVSAKIVEINYDIENSTINLVIANEKDIKDDADELVKILNNADLTSTLVSMSKDIWNTAESNNGMINEIINNKWDALKNSILAGYEQQIEISERGIIVKSLEDPLSWLVIQNGFLSITNDGGNTWKNAISKDGIWGEFIFGKVLSGVNLLIEDESGVWKTQGARTTIYKSRRKDDNGVWVDPEETMWLGLISDNSRDEFDNLVRQEDECFGLKAWNDVTQVEISTCTGIAISREKDDEWEKVFWANDDGTLYTKDIVAEGIKIVNDIGEEILNAETGTLNISNITNIVADGVFATNEKIQVINQLYTIHDDYKELLNQAQKYIVSKRDDVVDFDGAFTYGSFPTIESATHRYEVDDLVAAYAALTTYLSDYIKIVTPGVATNEQLNVDFYDPLTEKTSEIEDRGEFIQKFRDYYREAEKLRKAIEDSMFYSGIHMGDYYNNLIMNDKGFIAVRNDGKYRAFLNATNGLALQKWEETGQSGSGKYAWVNKLYASIGNSEYADGTLIAEELVAKKLRIETKFNEVLLDMDSLNINFGVLNSIVYDDIIVSIEKEALAAQWETISASYIALNGELDKYINEVYEDRENSYFALDGARTKLVLAKTSMTTAYSALNTVLRKVFLNMTETTHIVEDLGMSRSAFVDLFKNMYAAFEAARNALKDFLEKSSLQLGRNYNNTIIDAMDGVTVYRGDMKTRAQMNATKGFSMSRNDGSYSNPVWTDVFYVGAEGNLYAVDMTTHNLKIVDAELGEKITFDHEEGITIRGKDADIFLNANDAIRIKTKNGDDRFWADKNGDLFAKRLYIVGEDEKIIEDIDGSYISDLTVNSLKTLGVNNTQQDIIHIAENFMRFNTHYVPVGGNASEERTKMEFTYMKSGGSSFPVMILGAGNGRNYGQGSEKAMIYKDSNKFAIEYDAPQGAQTGTNKVTKFYFNQTDTDDSGQAVYFESKGGIRFHSDNKFVAKTADDKYVRVTNDDVILKFKNKVVRLNDAGLLIQNDDNNYINITSSGVDINGTRIDLN